MSTTARELEILRHSLGLDDGWRGRAWRNHFVAGGGDETVCRELVARGLMVEGRRSELTGGDPVFFVTELGKVAASVRQLATQPEAVE